VATKKSSQPERLSEPPKEEAKKKNLLNDPVQLPGKSQAAKADQGKKKGLLF